MPKFLLLNVIMHLGVYEGNSMLPIIVCNVVSPLIGITIFFPKAVIVVYIVNLLWGGRIPCNGFMVTSVVAGRSFKARLRIRIR